MPREAGMSKGVITVIAILRWLDPRQHPVISLGVR